MRKVFLVMGLCIFIVPIAMGQEIFIVTDDPHLEVEGAGNLGDYLRGLGYNVTVDEGDTGDQSADAVSAYRDEFDEGEAEYLESFDLVIVHRATSSGSFDQPEQWNSLEVPLLTGSSYLPRSDRWFWADVAQVRTAATGVNITQADHPIVAGLTGEFYQIPLDIDHLSDGDVGEGEVIATITDAEGNEGIAIAAWEADDAFAAAGGQTHTYPRVFVPFFRYHEEDAGGTFEDYTQNGLDIIAQAVEYTLSLEGGAPSGSANWESYE